MLNKPLASDQYKYGESAVCGSDCLPGEALKADGNAHVSHFFSHLFDTRDWPARWHCGTWSDFHEWLYIVSDIVIWLAYFAIPVILIFLIQKRTDIPFPRIIWLFVAFIILCGSTHLLDAILFWWPAYRLSAMFRFITAIVSGFTVFALFKVVPQVISLRYVTELEIEINEKKIA